MKSLLKLCIALTAFWTVHSALAHWPDQSPHQIAELGEFQFEGGGSIPNLRMSYVTHGKLNAAKDNAILFIHGFAANHHLFDHMIGPGRPLDTDKYFVICPDALGATQTNYEHSTSPTNSGLKMKFPQYNGRDMNKAMHKLITEKLEILHLLMVTGISSGADHSVQFAVSYPDLMDSIVPLVGGALWTSQGYFLNPLMASIIESCDGWHTGDYDKNPATCATNGLFPLIPYLYTREWWDQYIDAPEAYDRWRKNWGAFYLDVQDARDLYYRIRAESAGWVGDTPGFDNDLNVALASIKARTLFVYSLQDQFYVPQQIETQVKAIPGARSVAIESPAGHLICCNGDPNATHAIGEAYKSFLGELASRKAARR
jgi:homoserine O-acetyltransferase/O-succinyltransferase